MTECYQLAPDVHAVAIDEDLVFLDVGRDRYLCLPAMGSRCEDLQGVVCRSGSALATALEGADLLIPAEGGASSRRPLPVMPGRTVLTAERAGEDLRPLLTAPLVISEVRRARRRPGLKPWLDMAGPRERGDRNVDRVVAAAQAHWWWRPAIPLDGLCLQQSAMLAAHLRRCSLRADWVFGVRLWPFAAHCWLQAGEVCLNDDLEALAPYTPIFCR